MFYAVVIFNPEMVEDIYLFSTEQSAIKALVKWTSSYEYDQISWQSKFHVRCVNGSIVKVAHVLRTEN
jgi:ferritin-like metal-binding protein YciE